jgi:outer membrane receptor for ferrienterochelin and colicin
VVDPAGVDGRGCFRGRPGSGFLPVQQLDAVQVTGSRIPRAQVEGPAPITVINAEQIRSSGFTSVPDVLRAMTQNGGETQSQQSSSGADFSPGAQQVDLRGLGPNHTLVLVNGRRIADFPMPFKGRSNFTDVSNIPLGMIERIEVLTGSASAIYGSDAIAGVVNFILKKKADGTTIDMRMGTTTEGGGESFDMSRQRFQPWQLQRRIQRRTAVADAAVGL